MIERKVQTKAKIGTFWVVHNTYFGQFEGLEESLNNYHATFLEKIKNNDSEIIDFGMVDSSERAYEVLARMKAENLDLIFCNMITYATSSTFAPIIRDIDVPVVLVALQPRDHLDYTKANTFMQLENDNICSVPEFTGVAIRMGKKVQDVIIGTLYDDEQAENELKAWCSIANVLHSLKGARLGLMGHTMEAMYDMHADPTAVSAAFGLHVPLLEVDDVIELYDTVTEDEIQTKIKVIDEEFDMPEPESDPVTMKLTDDEYIRSVCHKAFSLWMPLISDADTVSVMLWTADGSELLDYSGNLDDEFDWANLCGVANRPNFSREKHDPKGVSLQFFPKYYMEDPL